MPRILLIDDNPLFLDALAGALQMHDGVQAVETCSGGIEGIECARQAAPELVFVDLRMPGMDGLETARHLRALLPGSMIVLVSLDDYQICAETFGRCGADLFVRKADLYRELPAILNRAASYGEKS